MVDLGHSLSSRSSHLVRNLRLISAGFLLAALMLMSNLARAQADDDVSTASAAPSSETNEKGAAPATADPDAAQPAAANIGPAITPNSKKSKIPQKYDVTKIGDRSIGKGLNLYSLERERALGAQLAQEVESGARLISDPVIVEYINRVGQRMVRSSDAQVPFTIKVIDDDEVNAFALPGGYFYVNSGLILAAENEAELAGVMAHEIAHVAARHATKTATRSQIFNMASVPLIFLGGPAGLAIRQVAGLAIPMSFLKFSRDAEREADLLGLEYEYAAGYDPAEFVHFFETIKAREREGKKANILAKAFATHPMTGDRIKRAQKEIETMLPGKPQYIVNTSEFDEVKARLAAMENSLRINSSAGTDRPTLRRRGSDDKKDDGGPTLRRLPN